MPELLTYPEVVEAGVRYTRQHLARLEAAGKFPRRVQIGEARVAWVEAEVRAWVKAKIKKRDDARPA